MKFIKEATVLLGCFLLAISLAHPAFGQQNKEQEMPLPPPEVAEEGHVYKVVEQMPKLKTKLEQLQLKLNYPDHARQAGIEGKVIVKFVVNKKGEVENPQVVQGLGYGCDEEALRLIKMAEFIPGKQHGKPVKVQDSLPITFQLQKRY